MPGHGHNYDTVYLGCVITLMKVLKELYSLVIRSEDNEYCWNVLTVRECQCSNLDIYNNLWAVLAVKMMLDQNF